MWNTILDTLAAVAAWPWLTPMANVARTTAALIGLIVGIHRAIRYWRNRHR